MKSDLSLWALHTRMATGNTKPRIPKYAFRGQENKLPSLDTGGSSTAPKSTVPYTGSAMLGVSTMHKSNSVPVFSKDDAIAIAKMRRG